MLMITINLLSFAGQSCLVQKAWQLERPNGEQMEINAVLLRS
jgi:hypothetical protein